MDKIINILSFDIQKQHVERKIIIDEYSLDCQLTGKCFFITQTTFRPQL